MKNIYIMGTLFLFSVLSAYSQIKNAETKTVSIKGNCESAKNLIEKAGNQKRISEVLFTPSKETAILTFDRTKTTSHEILKKIALAGFDNQEYFAPDNVYQSLAEDCKYKRDKTTIKHLHTSDSHESSMHNNQIANDVVLEAYFKLTEAFVQSSETEIKKQANELLSLLDISKSPAISDKEITNLKAQIQEIIKKNDIKEQRNHFAKISQSIYNWAKNTKLTTPVYYQNCPMFEGGSNWLSKDKSIRNPFYGNQMLTCGSTVETLK